MLTFNDRKTKKTARTTVNLAILAITMLTILNPIVTSAKTGFLSNMLKQSPVVESILSAAPESRMINPKTTLNVPDMTVNTVITAYSSTIDQCDSDPFIAASGKRVYDGMVAANFLPLGTKIKIPALYGAKIFTVDDRMNARYGYGRMDIWLDAPRWKAKEFGVKRLQVEVYLPEKKLVKK